MSNSTEDDLLGSAPLDDYARKYMAAGERVLGFHKQVSRGMLFGMLLGALVGMGVGVGKTLSRGGQPTVASIVIPLAILVPYLLVVSAFFGVTRVLVSDRFVRVSLGLFGPTIPLGAIVSASVIDTAYPVGVRPFRDFTSYNSGGAKRSAQIIWTKPDGTRHTTVVGSSNPELIVADIQRAIANTRGGVRVEADVAGQSTADAESAEIPARGAESEAARRG